MDSREKRFMKNVVSSDAKTIANSSAQQLLLNPVHKIFEQNALENPYSLAIRYNHRQITYAHLNQSANRLAHHLKNMKVGPEDRVAVCLEPSPEILVALLGILKVGATYVPLDPSYPNARVQAIIKSVRPLVIISEGYLASQLGIDRSILIQLNRLPALLPFHNPEENILSNQTAYIFNTSGSTGTPKGVKASYSNLYYYIMTAIDSYGMDNSTVMPSIARFSFSISFFELLCPLIAGGTVWMLDKDHVLDPARLSATLARISAFHCGPSLLKRLIPYIRSKYTDFTPFAGVRHVSSGGDMVSADLVESLKEIFSNADIFVIYGSTEIACMGCTYLVPRDRKMIKNYVGHPFANSNVLVVDEHCNPVPIGVEGEVCFAGDGVAIGFLDQTDNTKDRFRMINGQRFYRMGDIGRIDEKEGLELLGRMDFQIKIRGMRVELAEVEYQLRMAPGVKDALVAAKEFGSGENTLIAYVVFENHIIGNIERIHAHLINHLPEYMIPSCYAYLEELPLNHNLKIDRKALPDPKTIELHRVSGGLLRVPVTPTEINIGRLWCKLLGTNEVGLDDHFFDLGGHSLLAIELILSIEQIFNVVVEGMDVLRESLEVLSLIIDQRLGQQTHHSKLISPQNPLSFTNESFYFGSDSSLYGVLYKPKLPVRKTVLICGPYPYELDQCFFIVQQLARRLVSKGIAVMQFHYFGTGDSAGDSTINSLSRWGEDIDTAVTELKSYYPGMPMVGIGIRLGATLMWNIKNKALLERMVFWDPILDGQAYIEELEKLQHQKVSILMYSRNNRPPRSYSCSKELLGIRITQSALTQLKNIKIEPIQTAAQSVIWIATQDINTQCSTHQAVQPNEAFWKLRAEPINPKINWLDLQPDRLPDTGISKLLADAVEDL